MSFFRASSGRLAPDLPAKENPVEGALIHPSFPQGLRYCRADPDYEGLRTTSSS